MSDAGLLQHDAYLTSLNASHALHENKLLARCADAGTPLIDTVDGLHVAVIPVFRNENIHLFIEMKRSEPFGEQEVMLAQTLLSLYHDHLALIDYAETDTLTGLLNRKTFDEHLDRVLMDASTGDDTGAPHHLLRRRAVAGASNWLAMVDIDHFKRVNDTHGHLIGDEVLLLVAQMMQESFRFEDQLFRFGGEEFVAVLQPTELDNARQVLERFRQRIETHEFPIVGHVTVSLGFTAVSEYDNPPDLIDRADKALYYAKENGRNRMEHYEALYEIGAVGGQATRKASDIELF